MKPRYEVKDVVLPLTEQPLEQKHKVRGASAERVARTDDAANVCTWARRPSLA